MTDRKLVWSGVASVIVAAALLIAMLVRQTTSVRAEAEARSTLVGSGPRVRTQRVQSSPATQSLKLLGEARPYVTATLYAKVSGYLKEIRVDKGDPVAANQLLAVIESPELDQQYAAGAADTRNKRLNAKRLRDMVGHDASTEQETEQAEATADIADANLQTLETMRSYREIRAPFKGTVITRYADPGALVQSAANSQTSSLPVVTIGQTDRLRVYVYVDQSSAAFVKSGTPAEVTLPDRPGFSVSARVTRASGALDPRTRTMLVEVDLDNRSGSIIPGSFVNVALALNTNSRPQIPVAALVVRGDSVFVPVVDSADRVHYRRIAVTNNDGTNVQVLSGVSVGERIALNLGETVAEGGKIQPVEH